MLPRGSTWSYLQYMRFGLDGDQGSFYPSYSLKMDLFCFKLQCPRESTGVRVKNADTQASFLEVLE